LRYLFIRSGGVSPAEAIASAQTLSELFLLTLVMGIEDDSLCCPFRNGKKFVPWRAEGLAKSSLSDFFFFVQPNPVRKGWHALFRWLIPALLSDFYSDIHKQKSSMVLNAAASESFSLLVSWLLKP
jgi:hypothetical protein